MGEHTSVLLKESVSLLNPSRGGTYVDLTLGRGGHSEAILSLLPFGHLYAFDMDLEAIEKSRERLKPYEGRFTLIRSNFRFMKEQLKALGVESIDGLIMDLGVSSPQFDEGERGFSYKEEAKLDMRMDLSSPFSAYDIVNGYSEGELRRIFLEYGEDRDSAKVARNIVKAREAKAIETTTELVEVIKRSKSPKTLSKKGHPAKQIFQALRIATNDELGNLEAVLADFPSLMAKGGVVAAISFHSLEDRLIKRKFHSLTIIEGSRADLPLMDEEAPYRALTKKPITASEEELKSNHRAQSAKLRAIEKK